MTNDNDDDASVVNLDDTLSEILVASSRVATSLDLDLAFGAIDVNDDLACTSLLSPLSPLLPPIASPPSSVAAGSPSEIRKFSLSQSLFSPIGGCLVINFSISPYYNKLFSQVH